MARVLLRLKLTLLRAGLARSGARGAVGAVLALVLSLAFGGMGAALFVPVRLLDVPQATDATAAAFALLLLIWVLGPIVTAGAESTLEPDRLALFPLTRRQLMPGLLLAGAVGFGGVATALTLAGSLVANLPRSPLAVVTVAAAVTQLLLCVAASRLVATAVSGAARSRRWRDVVLFAIPATAIGVNLALQVFLRSAAATSGGMGDSSAISALRSTVRVLPSAPAAMAMGFARAGETLPALASLFAAGVVVAATLGAWGMVLDRVLTSARSSGSARQTRRAMPLVPRWAPFLPHGRVGAVAAKELRLTWRDPRQRAALLGAVFAAVVPAFSFRVLASDSPRILLLAAVPAYVLGASGANLYGFDGPAHWTNVAAGDDAASDLVGKSLARLLIALPLVVAALAFLTLRSGSVRFLVPAVGLAVASFGVNIGMSNLASVLAPVALPDDPTNIFSAGNSGQGLATAGPALAVVFASLLLIAPVLVPMLLFEGAAVLSVLSAAGVAYGVAAWWCGWRLAVRRSGDRQPELLASLS